MPSGMNLEQMLQAMGQQPVEAEPEEESKPARKRARDAAGRLKGDDPATPENEAWAES